MGGYPKSVTIADSRDIRASLRITRHAPERKIVLSHWRDGICVASTPIELSEVPALIGILAEAMGEAAAEPRRSAQVWVADGGVLAALRSAFGKFVRPAGAEITDLRAVRAAADPSVRSTSR